MKDIIGVFESGADARKAIVDLHAFGFGNDDIAFLLRGRDDDRTPSGVDEGRLTGRRVGELAADVGTTAASFIPFVGRNIVESPLGRALREATQEAGATAGLLVGALNDGGFSADQSASVARAQGSAAVTIRTEDSRAGDAMAVLARAGAVAVESATAK